jgi:hypothetical protein
MTNLKDLVKNTEAEFSCYRDGDLWYKIVYLSPDAGHAMSITESDILSFEFPVPVKDTGSGIFPNKIKAISLMRWVRQHLEKIQRGEWQ